MNSKRFNWFYHAQPSSALAGRALHCPRGKVIGGSSSINGMVWVRGNAADFDRWETLGAAGWSYRDVLPYFKKSERTSGNLDPVFRGTDGALAVSRGSMRNPLYEAFIAASVEAGFDRSEDLNGHQQEGFGEFEMSVENGIRCSSARAYLSPIQNRPNLQVLQNTSVERVLFDGNRATGIQLNKRGNRQQITANAEVLLSAGAIGSPQLLQLSGVGNSAQLKKLGIATVMHSPEVGENLQDHLEVYLQQACSPKQSLNRQLGLISKGLIGARWLLTQGGLGATNHFEAGGFARSSHAKWPDIQYHFLPAAISYDGKARAESPGFQLHTGPMKSPSRGSVSVCSSDPTIHPRIDFNYMSHDYDWQTFREAIEIGRSIIAQPPLAQYADKFGRGELQPGANVTTHQEIDDFVRQNAESAYHPCGTCRMGDDDAAVVDSVGSVRGTEGLRVIDASIFPEIPNGNLNAPTIMVAEKLADAILGRRLPPESVPSPLYKEQYKETSKVAKTVE
jgi:choline dehydrogenase